MAQKAVFELMKIEGENNMFEGARYLLLLRVQLLLNSFLYSFFSDQYCIYCQVSEEVSHN